MVNPYKTKAAREFPKPVVILGELIERRKEKENKFASLAQHMAVQVTLLLDVTLFKVKIRTGSPKKNKRPLEAIWKWYLSKKGLMTSGLVKNLLKIDSARTEALLRKR